MANTLRTRQGYEYWIRDGKYTSDVQDGYEWFDTLEELEEDIDWALLWVDGKAYKTVNGEWRFVPEIGKAKLLSLLDDLFGKPLTAEEFNTRRAVLEEQECWMIVDKYLTREEITETIREWAAAPVAA